MEILIISITTLVLLLLARVFHLQKRLSHSFGKYPSGKSVRRDSALFTSLIELRATADADRAFILRFHNGEEFSPSEDIWKLTCTHEMARPGVSFEASKIHSMIFSKLSNFVGPLLTGEFAAVGISRVGSCGVCPNNGSCIRNNRNIIVIHIDEVEASFEKFFFEEQNVKTLVLAGMVRNGMVFGVVGLHFTGAKRTGSELQSSVEKLCVSSLGMQHIINSK